MRGLAQPVVFDVNAFIDAVVTGRESFESWPSPHVLTNIEWVFEAPASEGGFEWETQFIEEYLEILVEISEGSGGGVAEPAEAITDCPDYEDNRILELALACQAAIIVSNDSDLLNLSPCRGIPVLSPRAFTGVSRRRRGRFDVNILVLFHDPRAPEVRPEYPLRRNPGLPLYFATAVLQATHLLELKRARLNRQANIGLSVARFRNPQTGSI